MPLNISTEIRQTPSRALRVARRYLLGGSVALTLVLFFASWPPRSLSAASAPPISVVHADTQLSAMDKIVRVDAAGVAAVSVSQKEKTFAPAAIEVRVGQSVEINNDDGTVHNAYCSAGDFKYNSGPQQPGTKSTLIFTAPGTYDVRCAIHPKMRLSVVVKP